MAYTPTTWTTGDDVTATKLNKLEQGVANAGSAMIVTDTSGTLDKTFSEIYDAFTSGKMCFVKYVDAVPSDLDDEYAYSVTLAPVLRIYKYFDLYRVFVAQSDNKALGLNAAGSPTIWSYEATDAQSYPTFYRMTDVASSSLSASTNRF